MMYYKVVLVCTLVAASSAQPLFLGLQDALNQLGVSATSAISLGHTTAHTGNNLVKDGVKGVTDIRQKLVENLSGLASTGLKGGVDATKQGIDIGVNAAGVIPGVSELAKMGGGVAKAGVDVGHMVGQTGINYGTKAINLKPKVVNGVVDYGTTLAGKGIDRGSGLALQGVSKGFGLASGILEKVGKAAESAIDYVNQASKKVSEYADGTAIKMSEGIKKP